MERKRFVIKMEIDSEQVVGALSSHECLRAWKAEVTEAYQTLSESLEPLLINDPGMVLYPKNPDSINPEFIVETTETVRRKIRRLTGVESTRTANRFEEMSTESAVETKPPNK